MFEIKDGKARSLEQTYDQAVLQQMLDRRLDRASRVAAQISHLQERAAKIDAEIEDLESGLTALKDGTDFEPKTRRGPG